MTTLWCWRCRQNVLMLDEDEWPEMQEKMRRGIRNIRVYRTETGASLAEAVESERLQTQYAEALEFYERLTGYREVNPLAFWHHRAAIYGPPCQICGKPLRTPKANLCAACGTRQVS